MAYAPQPYGNHPAAAAAAPGTIYSSMAAGAANPAVVGHGMSLGPPGVAMGRGTPMLMTPNGPAHPQGHPGQPGQHMVRYATAPMGMGRGIPNGLVAGAPMGMGRGMPQGMPGVSMGYQPQPSHAQMRLPGPGGPRLVPAHGGYLVNQHGVPVSYMTPAQQMQHQQGNPGAPGQPPHMMTPQQQQQLQQQQQQAGPGGPGQKLFQQQQQQQQPPFSQMPPGTMHAVPIGALPPPSGGSPVRNPSPGAATPAANAPTPGGPGRGAGMTKPPTPANASSYPPNAPTPGARPGTASAQNQNPAGYSHTTPRMQHADPMANQSSPGSLQRAPSVGAMSIQQQQQQQQQQSQQQAGGPGGPAGSGPGGMDHSMLYRATPAQRSEERNSQLFGPGSGAGQGPGQPGQGPQPMEGVRHMSVGMGPPGQPGQQQQQQGRPGQGMNMMSMQTMPMQSMQSMQSMHAMPALQSQHTGGSISSMPMQPLTPQHTGGAGGPSVRPLVPQHTGGSMQDTVMSGPNGAPLGSGPGGPGGVPATGRASVPSTPQNRPVSMTGMTGPGAPGPGPGPSGGPPGSGPEGPGGPGTLPMGMQMGPRGYPMMPPNNGAVPPSSMVPGEMRPPPLPHMTFGGLPMELGAMGAQGMMMGVPAPRRQAFGVLRLLQFSGQMKNLSGHDDEKWSPIIAENFTENATLSFRAQKETRQSINTFVTVPFPLLAPFFATLTQSSINRMSLILDGAVESQEGQEYTVFCKSARWPMYYDNGYILELSGVLRARCRTVPVTFSYSGPAPSGPTATPRMSSAAPNGMASSPSGSSNNMNASPTNHPSGIPNGADPKPPMHLANVPYMVKIEELSFDSNAVCKLLDFAAIEMDKFPKEPENVCGVPRMTMRMIEFVEGTQAMEAVIDYSLNMPGTYAPLDAFKQLAKTLPVNNSNSQEEQLKFQVHLAGGPIWTDINTAHILATQQGGAYVTMPDPPVSALSENVTTRATHTMDHNLPESSTTGSNPEPSVSPSIPPKTPGKKNTAPGSPTKASSSAASANGPAEKEKGGKRKSTADEGGPPTKQRRTQRKSSKAT